jgi:ATP-binding cassette, subfamily C (CFTR/MRP), member 1
MLISSFWTTHYLLVKLASNLMCRSLLTTFFKVDAHVGKSLFHDAILGALRKQGKTVIFVTHALHFLSYCDYIYTLRDGRLTEQGTFQELIAANGEFARLDKEYGGSDSQPTEKPQATTAVAGDIKSRLRSVYKRAGGTGKLEGKLIVKEQRTTGSIPLQSNSLFSDSS